MNLIDDSVFFLRGGGLSARVEEWEEEGANAFLLRYNILL